MKRFLPERKIKNRFVLHTYIRLHFNLKCTCSLLTFPKVHENNVVLQVQKSTFVVALNIFIEYIMQKDHHIGYSFQLTARDFFYIHRPTDRIVHTTTSVTPVVEH